MARTPHIAIVDYGLGNLFSIQSACEQAGLSVLITSDAAKLEASDAVLLPGVGAFANAMEALDGLGLTGPVKELALSGKPLIGICLGMQLLMTESCEFGLCAGLGLIEGTVERLPGGGDKVPHVGWSPVFEREPGVWRGTLLDGVENESYMYFVHSYYVCPKDEETVLSKSRFGERDFCSAIKRGTIMGCQFHPERSGAEGLLVYRNIHKFLSGGEVE